MIRCQEKSTNSYTHMTSQDVWRTLPKRVRALTTGLTPGLDETKSPQEKPSVIYWMSRDQRVNDNWALLYAQHLSGKLQADLQVVFCLSPGFLGATLRQYEFMLSGLKEVEKQLRKLGIPFLLLLGEASEVLPAWTEKNKPSAVICDFSPLRIAREWREKVSQQLQSQNIPLYEVDAHNVVPAWLASPKEEYSAATFRPKIMRLYPDFLTEFPKVTPQNSSLTSYASAVKWQEVRDQVSVDTTVEPVTWLKSGEEAAANQLDTFLKSRLPNYSQARNDALADGQSDLSPYLHFGQISAQRVLLELEKIPHQEENKNSFINEILVWRELAENFCLYQPHYDSLSGTRNWARKTLEESRQDPREFTYTLHQFDQAQTHDPLWNAAQKEMTQTGKMHGYMRMYWAKKILEWSATPEDALAIAIALNDRYELDGRDPNGYAGIMWSIAGVHDRPWFGRPVFGSIRFMAASGAQKKFDVAAYCAKFGEVWSKK